MSDETWSLLPLQVGDTFTMRVKTGETVTDGAALKSESSDDQVSSTGGYATSDILVSPCNASNDYKLVVGVALEDGAAGDDIGVAFNGVFIMQGNTVTAGAPVMMDTVANKPYTVLDVTAGNEHYKVGTALTGTSADDKYCIVRWEK